MEGVRNIYLPLLVFSVPLATIVNGSNCGDGYFLNYTLPIFGTCLEREHPNSGMWGTIPKLIPFSSAIPAPAKGRDAMGIPPGFRICKFPDCMMVPCKPGRCEETMESFVCHCPSGITGKTCGMSTGRETNSPESTETLVTEGTGVVTSSADPTETLTTEGTGRETSSAEPTETLTTEGTGRETSSAEPTETLTTEGTGRETSLAEPTETLTTEGTGRETSSAEPTETLTTEGTGRETSSAEPTETLTIKDYAVTPSVIDCPLNINQSTELGNVGSVVTWAPPRVAHASGTPTVIANINPGSVFNGSDENVEVFYTISDGSGWIDESCSFRVSLYYVDTTPPLVTWCPRNRTILASVDTVTAPVYWEEPNATDAAGIASITSNHEQGFEVAVGSSITITFNITDRSGLTNSDCSFTLEVLTETQEWKCTSSKCYNLDEQQRKWAVAKAFCSGLDPVLTVSGYRSPSLLFHNSNEEAADLRNLLSSHSEWVWINCNDHFKEGDFICDVDGAGTKQSSEWWHNGEPNNLLVSEDCVIVNYPLITDRLKWFDVPCSSQCLTVCQLILGQTKT
ncbi:hyalin-like isoform X2 [Lytechinus pictus]|uniref:hyalin-like isoform X2 n=1 Tax=Lytechinus pictus TaxID=7653 RepID=UPI0030B9CDCE